MESGVEVVDESLEEMLSDDVERRRVFVAYMSLLLLLLSSS